VLGGGGVVAKKADFGSGTRVATDGRRQQELVVVKD